MNPWRKTSGCLLGNGLWPISLFLLLLLLLAQVGSGLAVGQTPALMGSNWFQRPELHQIQIQIPREGVTALRKDARSYVSATVIEAGQRLGSVGIRVKGRTGSFRTIDDKPSFTLAFDHSDAQQRFHGFRKLHLNNSVEDPSYLHEKLGTEMFATAGIQGPWTTHALVTLNGRRLGLYVVKEGFTPEFLERSFGNGGGDLYEPEPGPGCDVDGPMKRDAGIRGNPPDPLTTLAGILKEPDANRRWERLDEILDRDTFITFLAMETLLGHRDGYGQARNNYRLYHQPTSGRFCFLPSGMDHLLGRSDATLHPRFSGLVAKAAQASRAGLAAYQAKLGVLFTNVMCAASWTNQVMGWGTALAAHSELTRRESTAIRNEAADLCRRFRERCTFVAQVLARRDPGPLQFTGDVAPLKGWQPIDAPSGGRMEIVELGGHRCLTIVAGPRTSAFWRTREQVDPGRYRFEANVRTHGVQRLPDGKFHGAGLIIRGPKSPPARFITGDTEWTRLETEFEIGKGPEQVEFSCGLRAAAGQAWFELESLRLVRLP
jgi:hypothetical protein